MKKADLIKNSLTKREFVTAMCDFYGYDHEYECLPSDERAGRVFISQRSDALKYAYATWERNALMVVIVYETKSGTRRRVYAPHFNFSICDMDELRNEICAAFADM